MTAPQPGDRADRKKQTLTEMLRQRAAVLIDPVAALLARYGVSPNVLTIGGMLAHFIVAWLITQGMMAAAGVAILLIAPLDAFDGALARLQQRPPAFGAFLDSTMDRLAEIILFGGFIFYFGRQGDTLLVATAYIALTGSLMVSYTRARAEALGASCKVGILSRVERYVLLTLFLFLNLPNVALIILAIFTYITVAQRIFHVWQQMNDA
ncbi:MAG: CDP-alcohol phosphatidyltransferase family protein [Candidatus Promineifilaceae bacterium]|nr:CDP-alcohol phosphatidyltransferase family protein [Candidatus Promineifilaceae bacterium]